MRLVWAVVCLTILAVVATAAPAPSPPPNPEIVFVEPGTTRKITVMNSDGSNKTVVHSERAYLTEPVWAPGGAAVAYTVSGVGLYVLDLSGGGRTLLLADAECGEFCWNPRYSPSGDRIAVIDGGLADPKVLSVPPTGGPLQVLYRGTPNIPLYDVAWSSDGSRIAVVETEGGGLPDRIVIIDLHTGSRMVVLEGPFDRINHLDWARQGVDRLVLDVGGDTTPTIYTLDLAVPGASLALVATGAHPGFSPDNASIVYRTNDAKRRIAKLNLATGQRVNLAFGIEPDWKR